MDAVVSGEAGSPVYQLLAEGVRSLVPTLQKLNIASAADVQIDSLADRLREEVIARRAVAMSYALVGMGKKASRHSPPKSAGRWQKHSKVENRHFISYTSIRSLRAAAI